MTDRETILLREESYAKDSLHRSPCSDGDMSGKLDEHKPHSERIGDEVVCTCFSENMSWIEELSAMRIIISSGSWLMTSLPNLPDRELDMGFGRKGAS